MPDPTTQALFAQALQHHRAGQLRQADQLYRQVIAKEPRHADALHNMALIATASGRNDIAIHLLQLAIAARPHSAGNYNAMGNALLGQGKRDEAINAYRRALALDRSFADAHSNLGKALKDNGQLTDAIAAYREAIRLAPTLFEAHNNLGNALEEAERFEEAVAALQKAIALKPGSAEAHRSLGHALKRAGRTQDAIAAYRKSLELNPSQPEALNNLGQALVAIQQIDQGIECYEKAIKLRPDYVIAFVNLGVALQQSERRDEAIAALEKAVSLDPNHFEAHNNLGASLLMSDRFEDAIRVYRRALQLGPGSAALANALMDVGHWDESIPLYRQAIANEPSPQQTYMNLIFAMNHLPHLSAKEIAEEHQQWAARYAEPLIQFSRPHTNVPDPDRRLRIGYVSPDFRRHAVAQFAMPLIASHHHDQFEIYLYPTSPRSDKVTEEFKRHADHWRPIWDASDQSAAEMIREDQIDILVDLAGHTGGNRLLVFAHKPAPVQVTYLGYPSTTGMTAIDYRFTDAHADPPGMTDALCTEKLFRLPRTDWCFQPPANCPDVALLPARSNGFITFGTFNKFTKTNPQTYKLWAQILHRVPGSKLLLKGRQLVAGETEKRVRSIFAELGIGDHQLDLRGWVPLAHHLAQYHLVDIGLDTFPYHGTTTTCEALYMGVPVVTLAGDSHVARVGVSLMTNVGLPELVAQSPAEYVDIAATLAADLARLEGIRAGLRQQMEQSPLMDKATFANDVETAYRQMWAEWCHSRSRKPA